MASSKKAYLRCFGSREALQGKRDGGKGERQEKERGEDLLLVAGGGKIENKLVYELTDVEIGGRVPKNDQRNECLHSHAAHWQRTREPTIGCAN